MKTPNIKETQSMNNENTSISGSIPDVSELVADYRPLVYAIASRYYGMEFDDLVQEGMLSLLNAAKCFDPSQGSSFGSFAALCIHRRLAAAVAKQQGKRREEISVSQLSPEEEKVFAKLTELGGDFANSPENLVIQQEDDAAWQKKLDDLLSKKEMQIVRLYLEGCSYQKIADELKTSVKAVDNGLQRIKRKLRNSMQQEKDF
jgi:RNA polymerase sporulation-specific sigma factor